MLGRDDIGSVGAGKAADLIAVDLNRIEYSGAGDIVAAAVFCGPVGVELSIINGRVLVEGGRLLGFDLDSVLRRHGEIASQMRG